MKTGLMKPLLKKPEYQCSYIFQVVLTILRVVLLLHTCLKKSNQNKHIH